MDRALIPRRLSETLAQFVDVFPAVALLGPRQVGKTTLAKAFAATRDSLYLDLESPADQARLSEPDLYLARHESRLVVLDEIHRVPGIFRILRSLIDEGRSRGVRSGRFLLLGSASIDLLRQSSESLAGRIAHLELSTLNVLESGQSGLDGLWVRGGFPDSFLALDDQWSLRWRENFIRTYLERDVALFGPRIPAETLRRFWTMLAHAQGGLFNASALARGLSLDGKTITRYLDLLVDLLLVRRLRPWSSNAGKRLVRSPRVYVRDSGIVHALLGLQGLDQLLGHPVAGPSWEGFVIENLITAAPQDTDTAFYRSAGGAELDLILTLPGRAPWAMEIKRSLNPRPKRGFHNACADIRPEKRFVVYPGTETFDIAEGVVAIPVHELARQLAAAG